MDGGAGGSVAAIEALIARYIDLFNAGDFAGAFACYRMPFTWLSGRHAITVASREEFLAMMTSTKAALEAKGLSASRLERVVVTMMEPHVAVAGVVVRRMRADGTELAELGGGYVVHDDGAGWRLAQNFSATVESVAGLARP
ncbi:MAG TPA: hypothetical protein VI199_03785 [Novosphingobium sp.]